MAGKATQFKKMLLDTEIAQVPSAYDCLSAKVIAKTGFQAVHMTGSGTSACLVGMADLGFATVTEMAEHAKRICLAVDLPVIADADTGYGNALNVIRTIREFEKSGIVGVHLEDQVTPKRCGHLEGKQLISMEEMVGKIEAACDAREDPDFTIIARTDALEQFGMEEALRRSRAYIEAGADCIFLEAPRSREHLELVRRELDAPLLANMVEGGKTPWFTAKELEEMGYNVVIYPLSGWLGAAVILKDLMHELKTAGTTQTYWQRTGMGMSFNELFDYFDYQQVEEWNSRFVRGSGAAVPKPVRETVGK